MTTLISLIYDGQIGDIISGTSKKGKWTFGTYKFITSMGDEYLLTVSGAAQNKLVQKLQDGDEIEAQLRFKVESFTRQDGTISHFQKIYLDGWTKAANASQGTALEKKKAAMSPFDKKDE